MKDKRLASILCLGIVMILIPAGVYSEGTEPEADKQIDINCATLEQLCAVPVIDCSLAIKIFDYRKRVGTIKSKEELRSLPGMTTEVWERISPWLKDVPSDRCVSPNPQPGDHDWEERPIMEIPKC